MRRRSHGWPDLVFGGSIAAILLLIVFLVADCAGGTALQADGAVVGKHYRPGYTTTSCDRDGCTSTYHPDEHNVAVVYADGLRGTLDVGARRFAHLNQGDSVLVHFRQGRWTGGHYLTAIADRPPRAGGRW